MPAQRREMTARAVAKKAMSITVACAACQTSESYYRYLAELQADCAQIADWLVRRKENNRNWLFGLRLLYLRDMKGYGWNHKRVYRIYRNLELNLRTRPKKRMVRQKREAWKVPQALNEVWSMDFMHDQFRDGRCTHLFNLLDYFNGEVLAIDVDCSPPALRVMRSLELLIHFRCTPVAI
jgi:putative transposase